jgi:hypothetical protein
MHLVNAPKKLFDFSASILVQNSSFLQCRRSQYAANVLPIIKSIRAAGIDTFKWHGRWLNT